MVQSVIISGYLLSSITRQMIPQYTLELYNPQGVDNIDIGKTGQQASGDNNDGLITITGSEFLRNFGGFRFL